MWDGVGLGGGRTVVLTTCIVCWQEDLTTERVVELVEELRQGKKPKVCDLRVGKESVLHLPVRCGKRSAVWLGC
jgi:hypothetical protein